MRRHEKSCFGPGNYGIGWRLSQPERGQMGNQQKAWNRERNSIPKDAPAEVVPVADSVVAVGANQRWAQSWD